jgi:hypothetical protein
MADETISGIEYPLPSPPGVTRNFVCLTCDTLISGSAAMTQHITNNPTHVVGEAYWTVASVPNPSKKIVTQTSQLTTSGYIVDQIIVTSGIIIQQITSPSGSVYEDMAQNFVSIDNMTSISGDIIAQIPTDYISESEMTTISGDLVNQIPSLAGYATESWVGGNYVSQANFTTYSGDLVDQIPSDYVSNTNFTTYSGDIVAQIPTDYVTLSELTTTSGDIVDYVDTELTNIDALPSGNLGYLLVHDGNQWYATPSGVFTATSGTFADEIVLGERVFNQSNTIIQPNYINFGGGIAYRGFAVMGDYTLTPGDHVVGVMSTGGDVGITIPDATTLDTNMYWHVVKISPDSNRITISGAVPNQFMGSYDQVILRNRGDSAWVKTYAAANMFFFEFPWMFDSFALPSLTTARPSLQGDVLHLYGNITDMGDNPHVSVYFNYRETGTSGWLESTAQRKLDTGVFNTTITGLDTLRCDVQAVAETVDGQTVSGIIYTTAHTYYDSTSAAESDSMARYWAFQESSGTTGREELADDDATFYGEPSVGSVTISGATIYHRIFVDNQYGQATYSLPASDTDFTVMIQIRSDTTSGDHTFINFGADVCGLAVDNDDIQINTRGEVTTWTTAIPFNEIKTLFMVCNRTSGWVRLYDLSSGSAVQRISRTTLPNADGDLVRFGRGAAGDGHHQDTEYLGTASDPGNIRSVGIWERALSTSDMEDIVDFLDNQGGILVESPEEPLEATVGEVNTASNLSSENNVGVFTEKVGVDLQFKSLDGDYFYNDANVIRIKDRANVIDVAQTGTRYSSIQSAINSITDAATDNRYLVSVHPGTYVEDVYMKDYVDVKGDAIDATTIQGQVYFLAASGCSATGDSHLRDLDVVKTLTTSGSLIYIETGEHSFSSVGLYLTSVNTANRVVTIVSGTNLIYLSRIQHVVSGDYTGSASNGMVLHQGGVFNWTVSQTVGVTYDDGTDCIVFESTADSDSSVGIYNCMNTLYSYTPTCTGTITAYRFNCGLQHAAVKGCRVHVTSIGGNETVYGFDIDSSAAGCNPQLNR